MLHRVTSGLALLGLFLLTCGLMAGCASDKKTTPPAPAAAAPAQAPPPPPAMLRQMKAELLGAKAQLEMTNASVNTLAKNRPPPTHKRTMTSLPAST